MFVLILVIRLFGKPAADHAFHKELKEISEIPDSGAFFIGSSRIQKSMNPAVFNQYFKNQNFYNVAFSGSAFMGNIAMAEYLLKAKSPKFLIIELSPILSEFSTDIQAFFDYVKIDKDYLLKRVYKDVNIYQKINLKLDKWNQDFFDAISIKENIKVMLSHNGLVEKRTGYIPKKENLFTRNKTFIRYDDIINQRFMNRSDLARYFHFIDYLKRKSDKVGTRLIFVLPMTYIREMERKTVSGIYQLLADDMKLVYTRNFIKKLKKTEYLYDYNHFNVKGAQLYSKMLCVLIEKFIR